MKEKKKHILILVLTSILILFSLSSNVFADSEDTVVEVEYQETDEILQSTDDILMPIQSTSIKEESVALKKLSKLLTTTFGSTLPESYITEGLTVKDQEDTGECWAFAFTSAFEAYNLAHTGTTKIFSPRHVDYSCSLKFSDGTKENSFNREVTEKVGNYYLATQYAASGQGPVLEEDMPFENNTNTISLSELDAETQMQLEKAVYFDSIYKKYADDGTVTCYYDSSFKKEVDIDSFRNKVKTQIKENGSVCALIYEGDWNIDLCVKDSSKGTNHGVLIVGWDDSYKADGWSNAGAYIALNSYGTDNFENGYIYISYDDYYVERGMYAIEEAGEVDYDNVYEHDELGATDTVSGKNFESFTQTGEISAVNIYERDNSVTEQLTEVGVTTYSYEQIEIYFTDKFTTSSSGSEPYDYTKIVSLTSTLDIGFTTFELDTPVDLTTEKFAILVRYIEANEEDIATVAVEKPVSYVDWWDTVTGNVGETYYIDVFSQTGNNTYHTFKTDSIPCINAAIKAYTVEGEEESGTTGDITSSKYTVSTTDKIITRIPLSTTVSTFKSNITVTGTYTLVDTSGNEVTSGIMKTGYKIKTENEVEYTISVISDINGDGKINIIDLAKLRSHLVEKEGYILTGVYLDAADVSGDGNVNTIDLSKIRELLVE